jgi:hypothetical protein
MKHPKYWWNFIFYPKVNIHPKKSDTIPRFFSNWAILFFEKELLYRLKKKLYRFLAISRQKKTLIQHIIWCGTWRHGVRTRSNRRPSSVAKKKKVKKRKEICKENFFRHGIFRKVMTQFL